MALPKLNESPSYQLVIPSTQKQVNFRPYLVKEEKVLLIAFESGDEQQILKAVLNTLAACITPEIDPSYLTTFDVEYMFTQIRAKSVGEVSKVGALCVECNEHSEIGVNLEEIYVTLPKEKKANKIKLAEGITVEMMYPSYSTLTNKGIILDGKTEGAFRLIGECMKAIETEEERIAVKDESEEDIAAFLESMTTSQFMLLAEFLKDIPRTTYDMKFTCEHCGHENDRKIEGMQNFF